MTAKDLQARIQAQAITLVADVHRAKLPETSKLAAEKIARDNGATRIDIQCAVARGVQAVLACVLLSSCTPAQAAVTPVTDTRADGVEAIETITLAPGVPLPGLRHVGLSHGTELWSDGEMWIRVRRVH